MNKLLRFILLPEEVSDFEAEYLKRTNRIAFAFFALHVPAYALIAFFNDTGAWLAVFLTLASLLGPALAMWTFRSPRAISLVYGFTAMAMGGLLVHFGQGPVQIEMHFYFFALLAMLAVYGNPLTILVAALTVAVHHLLFWIYLPTSVFNYAAPIWVVLVHAAFVVLESIATCYIARSFFDNVIGLERIVNERTKELDQRSRDMRLVLDHVSQGFLMIDRQGVMSREKSAVVERWLGPAEANLTFADYLERSVPDTAASFSLGFDEVIADILPLDLTLNQLPRKFSLGERYYRLAYTPIKNSSELEQVLVVISDVTADVERERLEVEQREVLTMFDRISRDKRGFLEFFEEAQELVIAIAAGQCDDVTTLKRMIHTLKGNSMIFGIHTVADLCHQMESSIIEENTRPSGEACTALETRWERLRKNLETVLGDKRHRTVEIEDKEYDAILRSVLRNDPRQQIARMIADWKLEPTAQRLARVAEQAHGIARRLNKGPIRVNISDHQLRLDPVRWASFWSAFVHVVRNSVDHGFEPRDERSALGKPAEGTLALSTRIEREEFVIEISDDGKGINWPAVAERARAKGIPHTSKTELVEALFCDGLSTAQYVNEFSGRGIGMGAVRTATEALGGLVKMTSTAGGGTRVEFRFPRDKMIVEPAPPSIPSTVSVPPPAPSVAAQRH